jgi:carboxypeptidase Taq
MQTNYQEYKRQLQKIADVRMAAAVLNWDQETYLPSKAAGIRAQQLSTLSGIAHEMFTDKTFGAILQALNQANAELSEKELSNVKLSLEDFTREQKYPTEWVIRLSQTIAEAYHNWVAARENHDFQQFAPSLAKLVDMKREEAKMLGYKEHPYDALLNLYEPGLTTAEMTRVFDSVKEPLKALLAKINTQKQVNDDFMRETFDKDKQWEFGMKLLKNIGFDFEAGRQDLSIHPFTTNFAPSDVRLTTKVDEEDFNAMTWSCLHEGGHGLYEQGLPEEEYGLPGGEAVSLGIHESQSRVLENIVGRILTYWKCHYSSLQEQFPEALKRVTLEDFYAAMNKVEPSFIRIEADELTYHFHVLIRFEIEKALIEGSLEVAQIPEAWNAKYKEYLGVEVPNDLKGCLQDIHWSHGSFGYFPTYSIGSFYAAQFFYYAEQAIPELASQLESGHCATLLGWLRENIHQYGRQYTADELCQRIGGESLNPTYFLNYAEAKYKAIYSF